MLREPRRLHHGEEARIQYFNGQGRMESIPWLLAAAGVTFEEKILETREDLENLRNDGYLMFHQVPMVKIDRRKLAQSYIANKYDLYGKDIKERALIGMYSEGMADLNEMIMVLPPGLPNQKDAKMTQIKDRTTNRYLPAFEKGRGLFSVGH
ncbi:glutathione S-transferase A2-like [Molossus molossus]|uniref:glutathione S-transferase A2-like n=1 Tax=Molossus molossus TaxID=27622 RepID=UPI001747A091|nr:glutathione S-transferase A2-like [Molossus molossus]